MDDGSVIVVEIESGNIVRVDPNGGKSIIARCGGGPNGAAFGPDGALYVCNDGGFGFKTEEGIRFPFELAAGNAGGAIQRVDIHTGSVTELYTHCGTDRLLALNDIVFDPSGSFHFVDTGAGALYYANPDGSSIRRVAGDLHLPNGMGVSPDGTRLYVSETYTGRLLGWNVARNGALEPTGLVYQADGHGWDGLAIDSAGNICAANLQHSGVTIIAPNGVLLQEVTVPLYDPYVTNVCFGGTDGRTAFITSSGRGKLYATEWPYPGLRLPFSR